MVNNSVVLAVAFQIHYYTILTKSADKTWAQMNATIWDQYVYHLSTDRYEVPLTVNQNRVESKHYCNLNPIPGPSRPRTATKRQRLRNDRESRSSLS